jgi:hypothetical protein
MPAGDAASAAGLCYGLNINGLQKVSKPNLYRYRVSLGGFDQSLSLPFMN